MTQMPIRFFNGKAINWFYFFQKDSDSKKNEEIEGEKSLNHDHLRDNFWNLDRIRKQKFDIMKHTGGFAPKKYIFERWTVIATMVAVEFHKWAF